MQSGKATPRYKRIMLKLSGEALMGSGSYGIDPETLSEVADEIKAVVDLGVECAVVIGGGNIFRGMNAASQGIDRAVGDHMGMLATVINGLALQNALEHRGVVTRVTSAIHIEEVAEPFIRRRAVRHLEKGRVVICAAGTGNPFFTTDSAAALRAAELGCELILKATKVDGIYTADPNTDPDAVKLPVISYQKALEMGLKVMDASAIDLARGSSIPICVFAMTEPGNIRRVVMGEQIGSLVTDNGEKS